MSGTPFSDPAAVRSMEAEHLPLWRAFLRVCAPLLVPGARVMDFGCNRGGMLRLLFEEAGTARPSFGVGIDVDTPPMRAILEAAAEAGRGRSPLLFTTAGPGSFPGQFDLLVSHEVVYLLPDLPRAFADIHAALAPGGHFCFATGCHPENLLFARWQASLESEGITACPRTIEEYEAALRAAGFGDLTRGRLLLPPAEYAAWTEARGSTEPNPAWFPSAAAEQEYYTRIGKLVLTGRKS